jgi:hypothetical protein
MISVCAFLFVLIFFLATHMAQIRCPNSILEEIITYSCNFDFNSYKLPKNERSVEGTCNFYGRISYFCSSSCFRCFFPAVTHSSPSQAGRRFFVFPRRLSTVLCLCAPHRVSRVLLDAQALNKILEVHLRFNRQ